MNMKIYFSYIFRLLLYINLFQNNLSKEKNTEIKCEWKGKFDNQLKSPKSKINKTIKNTQRLTIITGVLSANYKQSFEIRIFAF